MKTFGIYHSFLKSSGERWGALTWCMVHLLLSLTQVLKRYLCVARATQRLPRCPEPLNGAKWGFFSVTKAVRVLRAWTLGIFFFVWYSQCISYPCSIKTVVFLLTFKSWSFLRSYMAVIIRVLWTSYRTCPFPETTWTI